MLFYSEQCQCEQLDENYWLLLALVAQANPSLRIFQNISLSGYIKRVAISNEASIAVCSVYVLTYSSLAFVYPLIIKCRYDFIRSNAFRHVWNI